MGRYLAARIGQAILVVFALTIVAFAVVRLVPGDPGRLVLGPKAPTSSVAALDGQLGLDRPLLGQYVRYVNELLQGNLGTSISEEEPVASLLGPRVLTSLLLVALAAFVAIVLAVPLAVLSATRRNRFADHLVRLFSTVAYAMPTFWLALLLVLLFSLRLKLFPTSGYGTGLLQHLWSLALPALSLGIFLAPLLLRTLRATLVDTLGSEHVEASRARGLSERRVLFKHALRNSLLAPLTVLGVFIAVLLSQAVVVENVFALPGLGTLLVQAVTQRDYPTIEGLVLVFGVAVVIVNLVTDLLYLVIDPRVRL